MTHPCKKVFVLGAGFTKAFLPHAPLLVDNYNLAPLMDKFGHFDNALRILQQEQTRLADGKVDIERLLTRLDGTPFDRDDAPYQFAQLKQDVHSLFRNNLNQAKTEGGHLDDLVQFAHYCIDNRITCITFNYDDVFDEALRKANTDFQITFDKPYWHPDGGYGFFLRGSEWVLGDSSWTFAIKTSMLLLKLHGSINWRIKLGFTKPYSLDAIVHHSRWGAEERNREQNEEAIESHLTEEMFIVPPVLAKSSLEEPILRKIWGKAYTALHDADEVAFVGYSCPVTDLAVTFLFSEAISSKGRGVTIVNKKESNKEREKLRVAYRSTLPDIQDSQFQFRDALEWARELVADQQQTNSG